MPQCSDYGENWVGEYPSCRYESSTPSGSQDTAPFTGEVSSLGFLGLLPEGQDWSEYFDPYDPRREEMAGRHAGIDVGQLQSAWDLQSGQLGEAWGLREEQLGEAWGLRGGQLGEAWGLRGAQLGETLGLGRQQLGESFRLQEGSLGQQWGGQQQQLGAGARRGYQDVTRMGEQRQVKGRGLMFGEQRQRQAEEEVSGAYAQSFGLGQSAYEQAMASGQSRYRQGLESQTVGYEQAMATGQQGYEQAMETGEMGYQQALETGELGYTQALETGELGLAQASTDIYQGLESDIFGYQENWLEQQRATLNTILGMDPSRLTDDDDSGGGCGCYGSGYFLSGTNCVDVTGSVIGGACGPSPGGTGGGGDGNGAERNP